MSSAQRSMHYARALLRAFQKVEPSLISPRSCGAGAAAREASSVKPLQGTTRLQSLRDSDLHAANSLQKVQRSPQNGMVREFL